MKIAIDLSPLQNAHRMRGIGFTLINLLNNLPEQAKKEHDFVFYTLPKKESLFEDPFELVDLTGVRYETRELKPQKHIDFRLPGRLNLPIGAVNRLIRFHSFYYGDSRVGRLGDVDVFLQADQNHPLPGGRNLKKVLIIYDVIPQVLEWDYLRTYRTARLQGASRKGALACHIKRHLLINKTRTNTKAAHQLIAISEHTKKDFVGFLRVPANKITVCPLGVTKPKANSPKPSLEQYKKTGWGYIKKPLELDPKVPFLLFIGGVDSRRKLEDLVGAFNNLRAQGHVLKLVLVGDIMLGPSAITTPQIRRSLAASSYLDDIVFMGFADDDAKDWLFANALAYVFPSRYEGFGLPVLEAMIRNCPVISYQNGAVTEVAGNAPLYANDLHSLMGRVTELLSYSDKELAALRKKGALVAKKYDWSRTAANIIEILYNHN